MIREIWHVEVTASNLPIQFQYNSFPQCAIKDKVSGAIRIITSDYAISHFGSFSVLFRYLYHLLFTRFRMSNKKRTGYPLPILFLRSQRPAMPL